ncbi:Putative Ca2+/H+ antiporter, TMEM165/GDT1 family [Proteiniborus ethanoligenes]|uniref:GDT1 family protein n=1 Tax=Proteiniborus ethanoligenes TaxID=415015 RepID=A0A1H3KXD5_9FIRM|nr:TMEM165/GDT1 family protein [Proteiniborus ethanoligenes]SDY56388.1 Putative Ca2+/H+ antiporter, TMEM165/GDT1 family [Proteiniborus ethanoligenes]
MIQELVKAFFFIFVAEMGDKTQILAMTFATQYKVQKVLLGVLIGSALNHGIAIVLGSYLSTLVPLDKIQIIAGLMFIVFGLMALRSHDEEKEDNKRSFGPVLTVALAFFLGELGDKTQLTAMTLAVDSEYPTFILLGAVLGMLATSGLGIFIGTIIGDKVPEFTIKVISSAIFIFFGTLKLFQTVPKEYISGFSIGIYFSFLTLLIYILLKPILKAKKEERRLPMQEIAATLYDQANEIKKAVEDICIGESICGECIGSRCLVGFAKRALKSAIEEETYILPSEWEELPKINGKSFPQGKVVEALSLTLSHLIKYGGNHDDNYVVNKARQALEIIAFGETIPFYGDVKNYFKEMKKRNEKLSSRIIKRIEEINEA